ncbi:MAG: LacI family DNA-binding transcriptional regulator [Hyphomicrobiaceae bacterium]|nr:LacI family DNA-binding transcriptional regulator [Hyphomicrobiaceae bacterium]
MKSTLADVAREAGVSLTTVDRVINRRGSVRPETEQAVLDVARRIGLDRSLNLVPVSLLRFNLVMHQSRAGFFRKMQRSLRLAQNKFRHLNVVLNTFWFDLDKQEGPGLAIERAARHCHGLIYVGPDHPEAVDALQRVPPECPILTFATDIFAIRRAAYFGLDNHSIGRLAGDLIGRFLGGKTGKVLPLIGLSRYVGHRQREAGFRSVIAERHPHIAVLKTFETHEVPDNARRHVAEQMRHHPDLIGIYNSSNGNLAISELLTETGKQDLTFINHELTQSTRTFLMNGVIDVIIDHNTDNEFLNALEYLLFINHRMTAEEMRNRNNLDLYFRETAVQAVPAV